MSTGTVAAPTWHDQPTTFLIKGAKLGVRAHFTQTEWDRILGYDKPRNISSLLSRPLEQYEDLSFLRKRHSFLERRYIRVLAFYHRIRLPLRYALTQLYRPQKFPVAELPNMQELRRIVDLYYPQLFKMHAGNGHRRKLVSRQIESLVFSLWLAGYGVTSDVGGQPITTCLLEEIVALPLSHRIRQATRWLSRFLALEPRSPITQPLRIYEKELDVDRERRLWEDVLDRSSGDLVAMLHDYVFGELWDRTERAVVRTINHLEPGNDTTTLRVGKGKISLNTWRLASGALRKLANNCVSRGFDTIAQLLSADANGQTPLDHYMHGLSQTIAASGYDNCRSTVRTWLEWYSATHDGSINVKRLFPRLKHRQRRPFGKVLHMGAMLSLIQTLLDEQTPFIDENDLLQYRCRRAALVQLATGARIGSVCLLLHDCLSEKDGRTYLRMHKTKRGTEHIVEVPSDVVTWIREALLVSPDHEIAAPLGLNVPGDGLTRKRVFANAHDDGPLTRLHVNAFLIKLQKQLWPQAHPNGRAFTTHDFRRTKATEMLSQGKTKDDIKEQLGQTDVRALVPYLATGAPEIQQSFHQIFIEGVWHNVSTTPTTPDAIAVDSILAQSVKQTRGAAVEQFVMHLIQQASDDVGNQPVDLTTIPLSSISEGLPRMMHNCTAHHGVNCGHTELDCFSCLNHYRPDPDSYAVHLVELFRWMVRMLHGEELERRRKNKQRTEVFNAPILIREKLEQALRVLLGHKFELTAAARKDVGKRLWAAAQLYYRTHSKHHPVPSQQEAHDFLRNLPSTESPFTV